MKCLKEYFIFTGQKSSKARSTRGTSASIAPGGVDFDYDDHDDGADDDDEDYDDYDHVDKKAMLMSKVVG